MKEWEREQTVEGRSPSFPQVAISAPADVDAGSPGCAVNYCMLDPKI